jgi:hypothetical protein
MGCEHFATRVPPDSGAHEKWSAGSCVKAARPVASSLTSAANWPGSLSLQPCARSFETQHAELQYTLLRPAYSKAQTVRQLGCDLSSLASPAGARGAVGPLTVAVARAAPSSCMLPGPDGTDSPDGTLRYLRRQSQQVRCHTPWPAITVLSNDLNSLQTVCRHGETSASDSASGVLPPVELRGIGTGHAQNRLATENYGQY